MAVVQVGAIVAGLRRRRGVSSRWRTSSKPASSRVLTNLTSLSAEASARRDRWRRASRTIRPAVFRSDGRLDQTLGAAQRIVAGPARDGMALVAGVRAAMSALQGMREATRRRSATRAAAFEEEEESLFIG